MNSSKPTDGIISRHINRKVSIRISKILLKTGITPNHVSIITFLIALSAAFMFLRGNIILGGILTQLTSIIDGVDGEIARMKNMQTNFGAYFDSILDRYADALILSSITIFLYLNKNDFIIILVGLFALMGSPMSMLGREKFKALTGKEYSFDNEGILKYIPMTRDFRLFIIFLFSLINRVYYALIIIAVLTNLKTILRLFIVKRELR